MSRELPPLNALRAFEAAARLQSISKAGEELHVTHGAISRQKQLIGKLMRQVDPAPIQELLDKIAGVSDRHSGWLHQLERLREKLLTDPKAIEAFVAE